MYKRPDRVCALTNEYQRCLVEFDFQDDLAPRIVSAIADAHGALPPESPSLARRGYGQVRSPTVIATTEISIANWNTGGAARSAPRGLIGRVVTSTASFGHPQKFTGLAPDVRIRAFGDACSSLGKHLRRRSCPATGSPLALAQTGAV